MAAPRRSGIGKRANDWRAHPQGPQRRELERKLRPEQTFV
jgi:hypothetical protein